MYAKESLPLLLQILVAVFVLWVVAYGVAYCFQKPDAFEKWTKKQLNALWKKHWKFLLGMVVGAALAYSY